MQELKDKWKYSFTIKFSRCKKIATSLLPTPDLLAKVRNERSRCNCHATRKKVLVELIISPDIKEPDNVGVPQSGQKLSCQAIIASER